MRNETGFGVLLLGVVIGAALAILYAPDKGVKTRKVIVKRGSEALESAGEIVERSRKRFGV